MAFQPRCARVKLSRALKLSTATPARFGARSLGTAFYDGAASQGASDPALDHTCFARAWQAGQYVLTGPLNPQHRVLSSVF